MLTSRMANLERLYKKYLKKFRSCINEKSLLTEGEIIEAVFKGHSKKTGRPLFEGRYLPNLREMALIAVIPKDPENERLLKKYYGINKWKSMTRKYYIFTPKTARVNMVFNRLLDKFQEYLEDEEEIIGEVNKFITKMLQYELLLNSTIKPKERFERKPKEIKLRDKLANKYGEVFEIMFEKNKNAIHPEALQMRVEVKIMFIELLTLLNQEINISNPFIQEVKIE